MKRVRMQELAAACGVASSTVSRALRGDSRIQAGTRERIRAKARELGYRPNLAARALAAGKTKTLWMVLPGLDNPIEREAAQYASRFLLDAGYDLMVVQHHHDPAIYARILRRLTQGMADGAIIIPGIVPDSSMEDELLGRGYPLVFLDRHPRGLRAPTVTTANAAAADTLASLLVEAGARSLVVDFRESNPVAEERRRGSLAAALRLGVPAALSEELDRSPGFLAGQDPIGFLHSSPRAFAGILKRDPPALLRERIFLGVFDAAADAPYLASETVVCIQDFEEMARRAVALILGACGGETLIREIHTVPAKEFLRGPF